MLPVKEAEAVNSLADQGVDVVTMHVDSPKVVVETAERRGIFSSGYHVDQSRLAPKGYLTGAVWNWPKVYTDYVNSLREGKSWPHMIRGGLKEGIVRNVPYGSAVSEETRKRADAANAKFSDRDIQYLQGTDEGQRREGRDCRRHGVRQQGALARRHGLARRRRDRIASRLRPERRNGGLIFHASE